MKREKNVEPKGIRERLEKVRSSLLELHKALVDSERLEYEKIFGKVRSPTELLQLLTNDPWFAWLSPFSQLIVTIDETLESPEPLTAGVADALLKQSARLLVASETGSGFSKHYYDALQRDPNVVLAHADVAKIHSQSK